MSKNVHLFSSYHSELKSSKKGSFFELIASGQKEETRVPFLSLLRGGRKQTISQHEIHKRSDLEVDSIVEDSIRKVCILKNAHS